MSSVRATSMGVTRPPKPPCWRDFVLSTPKSTNSDVVDINEQLGRTLVARSPVPELVEISRVAVSLPGNKPSRLVRRPRARIHRTRSEHVILAEDLPDSGFSATLADTDPKGVRGRLPEGRLYVEENNRRCQNWLASIEAAEPLDKVDYTTEQQPTSSSNVDRTSDVVVQNNTRHTDEAHSRPTDGYLIPLYEQQQEVDVEVPEETSVWRAARGLRHRSPSSEEELDSPCRDIPHREGSYIISGKSHCPESVSPKLCSRGLANNPGLARPCGEHPVCEISSVDSDAKVFKCGKILCAKKIYKLCCDYEDTGSSSVRDTPSPCYHVNIDTGGKNQKPLAHIQEGEVSSMDSRVSSTARRVRSSSRPSTT